MLFLPALFPPSFFPSETFHADSLSFINKAPKSSIHKSYSFSMLVPAKIRYGLCITMPTKSPTIKICKYSSESITITKIFYGKGDVLENLYLPVTVKTAVELTLPCWLEALQLYSPQSTT